MTQPNWFLALPLPVSAGWLQAAETAPSGLRRFVPDDLHVTLAFLGACGEPAALAAWRALEPLSCPPVRIGAGSWCALGPQRQPSAYGLTLAEGHAELVALLAGWGEMALRSAGLPSPRQPPGGHVPLPHVTLLRPRRQEAPRWREPMQAWMRSAPLPARMPWLEELALWTWNADRSQRLFQPVRRRRLG